MAADKQFGAFTAEVHKAADEILKCVDRGKGILVISHIDADGISAAGILGKALLRIQANFCIRIERWLDENVVNEAYLQKDEDTLVVFTDMGSGYLDILSSNAKGKNLIILDHHQPIGKPEKNFTHVNPHIFGIDGTRDISSAGISYLVAKSISRENIDLACLAIVGGLGDLQDKYAEKKLGGINELIVKDALESGFLNVETDLLFFGRETRPIYKALAYTMNPHIPGISGEEDKSLAFLSDLNIELKRNDRWRALRDLSQDEKRRIFSALHDYLVSKGFRSEVAMSLLGTVYTLVKEEPWTPLRDAREYALLLNATGRMGVPGLGLAICMGDRGSSYEEAIKALEDYRQVITKYLRWIDENPDRIEEWENIYVLHGEKEIDEKSISAISTIITMNLPNPEKPLIAYVYVPNERIVKISARTVDSLTGIGLNLGEIVRIAAEKCLGIGGGHDIAAGAQVPYEQKVQFLRIIDSLVKEQKVKLKSDGSRDNTIL